MISTATCHCCGDYASQPLAKLQNEVVDATPGANVKNENQIRIVQPAKNRPLQPMDIIGKGLGQSLDCDPSVKQVSRARYNSPVPPALSRAWIPKGPSFLPEARAQPAKDVATMARTKHVQHQRRAGCSSERIAEAFAWQTRIANALSSPDSLPKSNSDALVWH